MFVTLSRVQPSSLLCLNIYFLTNEPTLSQPRIPHITVSSTQGTGFYRLLTHTVGMLRLNLLWLCDLLGLYNLGRSRWPLTMHPTITGIGGCPIPTLCSLTCHTLTFGRQGGRRLEGSYNLPQRTQLLKYLLHFV
jgi:hypothetical protein